MATDTDRGGVAAPDAGAADRFGRVSRTRGLLFRYLLLAGTLAGIVALGVLLVLVSLDAINPLTADDGWLAVYGLVGAAPTLGLVGYFLVRNRSAGSVGLMATVLAAGGVLAAGALFVVFVEFIAPEVWFAFVVGAVVAGLAFGGYRRIREGGPVEQAAVFAVVFGYTLFGIPGVIKSGPDLLLETPVLPTDWLVFVLTLGLPAGAVVGWLVWVRRGSRRGGVLAGVLVAGGALAAAFVAPLGGLPAGAGPVLVVTVGAPTGAYVERVLRDEELAGRRSGLLLPVVLFGGVALAELLVALLGFAGPAAWLDWQFLTSLPDPTPEAAGIYPALVGSVLLMLVVVVLAFPVGVGAAVYLEEYAPDNRYTRFVQLNISNLAGVPSVVYGLLGLGIFINFGGLAIGSVLVGGMTLALLILPIVVISAQEAIRSVPDSMRQASYGMGATRWQTVRNVVLPRALPGILTGTILALGRALGEAAPLLMIGAANVTFSVPGSLSDAVSAMPLIIFNWAFRPQQAFQHGAVAAGVITLLVVLLTMNSIAIVLRNRYQNEA